jgi:hypothetical protein
LRSPSFIKFYATRNNKPVSFSMVTDDENVIRKNSFYDLAFLLKNVPEGKRLFWIFAFCFKGEQHFIPTEARAVASRTFSYIFDHNSLAGFDRKNVGTGGTVNEIDRNLVTTTGKGIDYKDLEAQLTTVI